MYTYINNYLNNFKPYKTGRWCYEDGILMNAIWQLYLQTNNHEYHDFVIKYYDFMIDEEGNIKNYSLEEFNIDNIAPGHILFEVYADTKDKKYLLAIERLYRQLLKHPRTNDGNFWHKKRYPNQVWLDGIYMGLVFYSKYASYHHDTKLVEDIYKQLRNVDKYLYDSSRNLFVHAYDESKQMQWADKETGKSPNVWSRACGWLAMAFVDILETNTHLKELIIPYLKKLVDGLSVHLQDGMLYQVVDHESENGNYLETSGSAMLGYAVLKAVRLGVFPPSYARLGKKIYDTILKNYYYEKDGLYHLGGICKVAGLDNEVRNGSSEYYYSEEIVSDEVKGVAPFILLYNEILKIS